MCFNEDLLGKFNFESKELFYNIKIKLRVLIIIKIPFMISSCHFSN